MGKESDFQVVAVNDPFLTVEYMVSRFCMKKYASLSRLAVAKS